MFKTIKIEMLQANTGQIKGLPKNPRKWSEEDLQDLAESLREDPELYEARPCLVVPHKGEFVVLGGNMRLAASALNGDAEVPCYVYPKDTPLEKLKRVAMKDNASFGAWDTSAFAKDWDWVPAKKWHVPDFGAVEAGEDEREPRSNSRAAGSDDVSAEHTFALRVECNDADTQLALLEELTERGFAATIA